MGNIQQDVVGNKARWVRVSVEIFEHSMFDGDEYCDRSAWLWLIANAAWRPRSYRPSGVNVVIELQRGQVPVGREYLAKKWGWSEKRVRSFLTFLQAENMIKMGQSKGRYANIATICNYEKYQSPGDYEGQLQDGLEAGSGPVEGHTLTSNTNTTNTSSLVTTAAREAPVAATPPERLSDRLIEAASGCLGNPVNCQGLLSEAIPMMWIESGCDLERDILPTLRAAAISRKGKNINSWVYFTNMISEAKAKRLAGMPTSNVKYIDRTNMVYQPSRFGPGKWVPKSAEATA